MKVELLSHYMSDKEIANCARVSYGKDASNYTEKQNSGLINTLIREGHDAPFHHPHLSFRIQCPIYVERQIFKTAIGVCVNSISGRYVDFKDSYYRIEKFRQQSIDSKQGSGDDLCEEKNNSALQIQEEIIEKAKIDYEKLLSLGVCKEQARSILPLNLETTFIWTGSLSALFRLHSLRSKSDAQKETREVVLEMYKQIKLIEGNPFDKSIKYYEKKNCINIELKKILDIFMKNSDTDNDGKSYLKLLNEMLSK